MTHPADYSVRELGLVRLRLRGNLTFTPQTGNAEPYYLVEDPLNSRFFRLGVVEYTFVSLLDGNTTIHEALQGLSTVYPHHHLTESDAAGLCRWLVEMDLAHTVESAQAVPLARTAQKAGYRKALVQWNPLFFKLPLGRPDQILDRLTVWFGWLHSPPAFIAWLLLVISGSYLVVSDWDRFLASSRCVFAPNNWVWLGACWLVLKVVHEASHGIACRRYGGSVREVGAMFILFAPLAYVDVTSSWRFKNRRERIHVAAAGMYLELLIAAVCSLVWKNTDAGWLNSLCVNAICMASVTTILFNANPLMKFDGYYMLSDGLGLPNLYANGQQYLTYWAKRYLLGIRSVLPSWSQRESVLIRIYGVSSFVWRMLVVISLIVTATTLFQGAGVILAAVAVALWLCLPAIGFVRYLLFGKPGETPNRWQFGLTVGPTLVVLAGTLGFVPWPGASRAPAVVEYAPHTVLRASSPGFVRDLRVQDGQPVKAGQILLVLENRELVRERADLEIQIRQSVVRGQRHEQKGELALKQAEAKNREALTARAAEKQSQIEQLTVRAPRRGRVVCRNLTALQDTYLEAGDEILAIGDESQKELRVSVSQDDLDLFSRFTGETVEIDVPRLPLWNAPLATVVPRASVTPAHPALATANGGPLPVKPALRQADSSATETHELLVPHFTAMIPLSAAQSMQLYSGQLATIRLRSFHESIGQHLYQAISVWIRERIQPY